ncbi:MAG: phosphate ABC transporter ATP-binding protein PstB [Bdellovibrionota bacterium]
MVMQPSTSLLLKIEDLSVYYDKTQALKNITLSVRANGITALMGPSGCGKSTFLRAINRMHQLYDSIKLTGSIRLESHDIDLLAHDTPVEWVRTHIGMVFQKPNPFPKTIFENVAYGLRVQGVKNKNELEGKVQKALESAGLWKEAKDRLQKNAFTLSGGQQQRLCIARALAPEPEVLLMDEPTSALDPVSTQVIEELVMSLCEETSIMLVTHNMHQARRISNDVAFLYLGELLESGTTEQVFGDPKHETTRSYLLGSIG